MLLDSNPHLLSAKTQDYPLGYRGIMISFIQISDNRTISSAPFTKIHEDWVKCHWIFICLGSILTNITFYCQKTSPITVIISDVTVLYTIFTSRFNITVNWDYLHAQNQGKLASVCL